MVIEADYTEAAERSLMDQFHPHFLRASTSPPYPIIQPYVPLQSLSHSVQKNVDNEKHAIDFTSDKHDELVDRPDGLEESRRASREQEA
jgi:hypothetical protein